MAGDGDLVASRHRSQKGGEMAVGFKRTNTAQMGDFQYVTLLPFAILLGLSNPGP